MHVVEVSNNGFTPSNLTIEVNDTVRWIRIQGFHNVIADDRSFTSGDPSSNPWVFDNVFTAAGSNPYYCVIHGNQGGVGMSGVITVQTATSVAGDNNFPKNFRLNQNYPNPFNPSTLIKYQLPERGLVILKIFNSLGQEVAELVNETKPAGTYEVDFNATDLTSGVYIYQLKAGDYVEREDGVGEIKWRKNYESQKFIHYCIHYISHSWTR
jgi:hypothetical protein